MQLKILRHRKNNYRLRYKNIGKLKKYLKLFD